MENILRGGVLALAADPETPKLADEVFAPPQDSGTWSETIAGLQYTYGAASRAAVTLLSARFDLPADALVIVADVLSRGVRDAVLCSPRSAVVNAEVMAAHKFARGTQP